jgi:hypothetical protein
MRFGFASFLTMGAYNRKHRQRKINLSRCYNITISQALAGIAY